MIQTTFSKGYLDKTYFPSIYRTGAALVHMLMLTLIRDHESLFTRVPLPISACPPGALRASPGALRQPHLQPLPCFRQLSLPVISQSSKDTGQAITENSRYYRSDLAKRHYSKHPHHFTGSLALNMQPAGKVLRVG